MAASCMPEVTLVTIDHLLSEITKTTSEQLSTHNNITLGEEQLATLQLLPLNLSNRMHMTHCINQDVCVLYSDDVIVPQNQLII